MKYRRKEIVPSFCNILNNLKIHQFLLNLLVKLCLFHSENKFVSCDK